MISDILSSAYPWVKSLHVMAVLSWMAGLFYLPRLFVYHVEGLRKQGVTQGSDMDLLFQHQERLLLKAIMTPAMIVAWVAGLMIAVTPGIVDWSAIWPWTKAVSVLGMTWFHMELGRARKVFVAGQNQRSGRYWRMMNEIPTVFMIVIVLSVIVKF